MTDSAIIGTGTPKQARLVSLDAFRGAVIALMVLVNNGGGPTSYHQLQHSEWEGWTLTDTVFPAFLWMVGLSITMSLSRRLADGVPARRLAAQITRRSVTLFAIGLFIYLYPEFHFATMRIPGVLQRIAVCYFAASLIYLRTRLRGQMIWILGLLIAYWGLMTFGPVASTAGRYSLEGNFAHVVDRLVFGAHNYHGGDWDPEGLVSTLPAIATTLFGVLAGDLIRRNASISRKALLLAATGAPLMIAGLTGSHWMPINKKLWTDTFSLLMAGLDCVVFAAFLWTIDGLQLRGWTKPFTVLGRNAIAVYVASELLSSTLDATDAHEWIYERGFAPIASPANDSLLFAAGFVAVIWLPAWALYRKGWFWRI